ncbi:MAG: peptidoglycan-binding protein, partial [Spirochaetaceae bacterium]
ELVAVTDHDLAFDPNLIPDVQLADLTGDGVPEIIAFATDPDAELPIVVYRFERRNGAPRVLAFSLCSPRMYGDDVRSVQRALVRAGFPVGPHGIDGWYGPDTRAAVIRFQRSRSMPVTGVVDHAVRAALE